MLKPKFFKFAASRLGHQPVVFQGAEIIQYAFQRDLVCFGRQGLLQVPNAVPERKNEFVVFLQQFDLLDGRGRKIEHDPFHGFFAFFMPIDHYDGGDQDQQEQQQGDDFFPVHSFLR